MSFLAPVALGVQAISSIAGGEAASSNANYMAQVAKNNAVIAQQNAAYAGQAGSEAATNESLKGAGTGARIKTSQAANGVDVNSGSAVNVQESQREASSLDTAQTMNNALLKVYGYQTVASNETAQAGLDTAEAGQDETAGFLKAGGSLLGGASGVSNPFSSLSFGLGGAQTGGN